MLRNTHDPVWSEVTERAGACCALADRIWETPETGFREHRAAAEHKAMLEAEGFSVRAGVAGMPTALMAEAGNGGPVIAFLGEYDALPGLSQRAGTAKREELVPGGDGHGCGHNLLGTGSLLAAVALKGWLEKAGIAARVRYYGCPAEESGSGKGFMVREGLFDDVDVAFCWHPAPFASVNPPVSLACCEMVFDFEGRAAHAAANPELGRSALDAVELMNVGVNYMREHMPSSARVHYAITDAGGAAPNVVQARASVRYMVRARELDQLTPLIARVRKMAEGAAMMTETSVAHRVVSGEANLLGNRPLEELMQSVLERLGPPEFDDADRAFAAEIRATLSDADIRAALNRFGRDGDMDRLLGDVVIPLGAGDTSMVGSTDVGTVSWVVPTVQMRGATHVVGTPLHSWQLVAQGQSGIAHKGMVHAAKVMAATARILLESPELMVEVKEDFARQRAGRPFVNPLHDGVMPDLP